jgi:hypothetical protein
MGEILDLCEDQGTLQVSKGNIVKYLIDDSDLWGRIFRRVWTKASDAERTTPIHTLRQHLLSSAIGVPFGASWDLDPCCCRF